MAQLPTSYEGERKDREAHAIAFSSIYCFSHPDQPTKSSILWRRPKEALQQPAIAADREEISKKTRKDSGHGMNTTVDLCISATACMLQHMDSDPDEDQQMTEPHPAR